MEYPVGGVSGGVLTVVGKKRGRKGIYGGEGLRLTASAALHGFILPGDFEYPMAELKTKFDQFVNKSFFAQGQDDGDLEQVAVHQNVHIATLKLGKTQGNVQS